MPTDPVQELHEFPQTGENEILWRYMSFEKFIWFLKNEQLYQPSISSFNDPFEGSLPRGTKKEYEKKYSEWQATLNLRSMGINLNDYKNEQLLEFEKQRKLLRDTTYASCWCLRNTESEALWKIYCQPQNGIVIKTTYGKLKKMASSSVDIIGKVQYLDYNTEKFELFSPVTPFMYKRTSFDYESEVRILTSYKLFKGFEETMPNSQVINVDIEELVDAIFVYPYSKKDYIEYVKTETKIHSKNLSKLVRKSEMIDEPTY